MPGPVVLLSIVWVIALLFMGWTIWRLIKTTGASPGKVLVWKLDAQRNTRLVSNRALSSRQQLTERGGILEPSDLVVVWAQQFLDHDILYDTVLANIHARVRYLYVLDQKHTRPFQSLLDKLRDDTPHEGLLESAIDVIFVRPELTLGNLVLMAADTGREELYSSLIFDYRPFAWVRQDHYRVSVFLRTVKRLVMLLGIRQFYERNPPETSVADDFPYLDQASMLSPSEYQIMNFADLGRRIVEAAPRSLDEFHVDLRREIGATPFPSDAKVPPDTSETIERMRQRFTQA